MTDDDGNANNLDEEDAAAFSIKYLTSSKLMGLEVNELKGFVTLVSAAQAVIAFFLRYFFCSFIPFSLAAERSKFPSACSRAVPYIV